MMSYDCPHPVSRTYQYKKVTKPLLERKRRARINRCLDELKDLMVDALETEGEDISKLEKADILELTVRHLQRLQSTRVTDSNSKGDEISAESRWLSGFGHCAAEACRFLSALPGEAAERLARHLAAGLQTSRQTNSPINLQVRLQDAIQKSQQEISNLILNTTNSGLVSPTLANLELTANLVAPTTVQSSQSSQNSSGDEIPKSPSIRHSSQRMTPYPEVVSVEDPTVNIDLVVSSVPTASNEPPNLNNEEALKRLETFKVEEVTVEGTPEKLKKNEVIVNIEDEEEIDVEGVDEADPMWRPW